jgi:hypothetical protein
MSDADDDLGGAQAPYRVIAVIPVHGRLDLLPYTIQRLYRKNDVYRVICVGDGAVEKAVCEYEGARWVPYQNKPLGAKWNAGFLEAKKYNPDAVLYVGSSDWLSNNWIPIMKPHVDQYGMVGVPGCHFIDIADKLRAVYWPGYIGERSNETIGIGRMLSKDLLDKIDWKPFHDDKDSSLDRSMKDKAAKAGVPEFFVKDDRLKALSISTNKWINKHKFDMHWMNQLPSEKISDVDSFVNENLPEIKPLQKELLLK